MRIIRNDSWFLLTLCLALGLGIAQGQVPNSDYKPLVLPSGDPFPSSEAELLHMRDTPNGKAIREMRAHAWDIFAGLINSDQPIWDTWYTKCDVQLELSKCKEKSQAPNNNSDHRRLIRGFEIPAQSLNQLELLEPPEVQLSGSARVRVTPSDNYETALSKFIADSRKNPQVAEVLFNKEAADHILGYCLYPQDGLQKQPKKDEPCPSQITAQGKVPSFPRGSVALKAVWAVVGSHGSAVNTIPTFNAAMWNEIHSEKDNPNDFPGEAVTVDLNNESCEDRDYKSGDQGVPLGCFYHFGPLTKPDIDKLQTTLSVIVDNGYFEVGNYVVLLALHVTTREIRDWVWATFWWDIHGASDWHAKGRPKLGPMWTHYLMNTTLSGMNPVEQDGGPKICFNPFLETNVSIKNGIISNCLQCHSKAAFGPLQGRAYDLGVLGRDGKALASGNPPVPDYFDKMVTTDFLWSIASANNKQAKAALADLYSFALNMK